MGNVGDSSSLGSINDGTIVAESSGSINPKTVAIIATVVIVAATIFALAYFAAPEIAANIVKSDHDHADPLVVAHMILSPAYMGIPLLATMLHVQPED